MKVILLCLIFLVSHFSLVGQDISLKETIEQYKKNAATAAMSGNFDKALVYTDSISFLAEKEENSRYMLVGKSFRGKIFQRMGKVKEAYNFFQEALEISGQIPTEEFEDNFTINSARADIYKSLVKLFHRQNKIDSVHVYGAKIHDLPCDQGTLWSKDYYISVLGEQGDLKKTLKIGHEVLNCYSISPENKPLLPKMLLSIAAIYTQLDQHETAIVYIDSSLQIAEVTKDSLSMLIAYDQLATECLALGNYQAALDWAIKSVQVAEKLPKQIAIKKPNTVFVEVPLAGTYAHLSIIYKANSKIDSAKYYARKSLLADYKTKSDDEIASMLVNIAGLIVDEGENYQAALDSLNKAYNIAPKYRDWIYLQLNIYLVKGKLYTKMNTMDSALVYYEKAEINAQKLEEDNVLAEVYQEIEAFYHSQKNYKKAYEYQILKIEQEKKIQEIKKQNSLLNFEIKYESEKLKLTNLELAKNQEIQAKEIAFTKTINTRNKSIIVGLLILILLLIGIAWLLYRQKKIQHQFRIMELEQKALKAQINPHFFFNVLNSLQATILSEKPKVAYKYHSKFTKLMRLILMQSDSDGISLKEELEALKLYLELEQLRTGDAFDFEIINEGNFEEAPIVPSMLLQPFVENSIWHGVMNRGKEEKKKITIHVHKKNNSVVCEIKDTGVGREQAQQIKQQKTKQYESMGIEVTQNRLELFQLRYKTPLRFSIQDIKDIKNKVLGTKVDLEIPIISK